MPIEVINTASLINGSFTRRNFAITSNGTHRLTGTTLLNSNGFTYQQNTLGDRLIATSPGGAGEYIANCYMNIPLTGKPMFNYSFHTVSYTHLTLPTILLV